MLQFALFSCFAVHPLRAVAIRFNIFRKLREIEILRSIFPDYVISCEYGQMGSL